MSPAASAELFDRVRQGDRLALEGLLDLWLPVVLAWSKRLAGPTVDPHDVTQDVLLIAFDRLGTVYTSDHLRAWLFGITRRTLALHRRRAWVRRWTGLGVDERASDDLPPDGMAARSETSRRVSQVLDTLAVQHREVLVLCDIEQYTDAEVAAMLEVPEGTVKSRLRRARAFFRDAAVEAGLGPYLDNLEEP